MAQAALITTRLELDRAFDASARQPVLIFKHSLICPLSTTAWRAYRDFLAGRGADGVLYTLIEIQNAREISHEVARRTGVRHESPQALLLRGGRAVWSASHWDITAEALEAAVGAAEGA
jgi:bacillithiol system protein YtxJ